MKRIIAFVGLVVLAAPASEAPIAQPSGAAQFDGIASVDLGPWERGKSGGRFIKASFAGDPKTFNPIVAAEVSTTDVTDNVYASVVKRNQITLEWEGDLAESWTLSPDQRTITYTLRAGLVWSDGRAITAEDVVWTVNSLLFNEDVEANGRDALFVGDDPSVWTRIDDRTFRVVLPNVYAGVFNLTGVQPVPKHIWEPVLAAGGAAAINSFQGVDANVATIVGSGPFLVSSYVPSQRVVMRKNARYYGSDQWGQKLPYLDEVVYEVVEDQDTELAKFLAGETDFLELRGQDVSTLVGRQQGLGVTLYNVGPSASTNFITMNQNPIEGGDDAGIAPPKLTWLSNLKFRQAMAHLVDRRTITNNIVYGFGYAQYSPIWSASPYYWEGSEAAGFEFNPERARRLLDDIGYTDRDGDGWREDPEGNKISLILNTNSGNREREAIGSIFSQEARKIGLDITFRPEDFNAMVGKLVGSYDWEMILIGLTGSVDPISGANVYPSSGNLHMIEPNQPSARRDWEKAVDAAWDEAALTTDDAQRVSGYEKLQRLWIEHVPWVYTFNSAKIFAYNNKWGNIRVHPIDDYDWEGILTRMYLK